MKKPILITTLIFALLCELLASGCKKKTTSIDTTLAQLQGYAKYFNDLGMPHYQEQAELALSKWQNGILDTEPILVYCHMYSSDYSDGRNASFSIMIYDEDMDIVGFGIKEESIDTQGIKTTLIEEYPVFAIFPQNYEYCLQTMKIYIRDKQQSKPIEQWQEYLNKSEQQLENEFDGSPLDGAWRGTLPPIYISIPEPNDVEVEIYLYDKAGHKSEPVKLRYESYIITF